MAPATGAVRTAPQRHGAPRRAPLRPVAPRQRRRARRPGRRTMLLALAVAVAGPLLVAGTYARITSGQVTLTRLQQALDQQQQRQSRLEQRVAELEDPATIVAEAKAEGMVPATSVADIPEVPLSSGSPGTSSSTGASASAGSSGVSAPTGSPTSTGTHHSHRGTTPAPTRRSA